ncbi:tRNA (adenine(22)-N(1))-methyltransferase [Jeotgalicoccus meleagridis]|uniref:tRNA (Adenine(22)-N(1))-methyltransferase n=1 Tax=Jeotgalicoccus meleagridis TaxID=2759181 RepID=A0A6V7RJP9_9STAP|nr:tRNA (adenine(22)-N(1))-methyltransferase TrmK [Jeotgalicoccus meleagridis]CAD2078191.1 tRNA (adenine(22)-N(1))-methyltransferase [Jeotgalicoccus meleagridis]
MLSERLKIVADFITGPNLVDIGSDHAYLPIYAVQNKIVNQALCGEVVQGPFEASQKNVENYGLSEQIEVRFGNGLEILKSSDTVDTITICGMGGPLIADIIDSGFNHLTSKPRFVIQANTYPKKIREVLVKRGYEITDEVQYKDGHHFYDIIVFDYVKEDPADYSDLELRFGPINLKNRTTLFIDDLNREKKHVEGILSGIKDVEKNEQQILKLKNNLKQISEVLALDEDK